MTILSHAKRLGYPKHTKVTNTKHTKLGNTKGLSFVELLAATAIISVAWLAMTSIGILSGQQLAVVDEKNQALQIIKNISAVESIFFTGVGDINFANASLLPAGCTEAAGNELDYTVNRQLDSITNLRRMLSCDLRAFSDNPINLIPGNQILNINATYTCQDGQQCINTSF